MAATSASAPLIRRLAVGIGLLNLFVIGLAVLSLVQGYRQYRERAEISSRNMADVLAQDIGCAVERIDLALSALVDDFARQGGGVEAMAPALSGMFRRLGDIDSMGMSDAAGNVLLWTGPMPAKRAFIGDRDYFRRLRDDPAAGLVLTKPVMGRITGKWQVALFHRLQGADGSFAGTVYAVILLDRLARMFSTLEVGQHGAVILRDSDFGLIVRHPAPEGSAGGPGQATVSPELRTMIGAHPDSGTYTARAGYDNILRTSSYHKVSDQPLYVIVALAVDDYLAGWWRDVEKILAIVALFSITTGLSFRILNRLRRSEALVHERTTALQQAKEAAEAADQAKSRFLAAVSHELRTPLNSILGFSELLRDKSISPDRDAHVDEYANYIHLAGSHLLDVITDILDISKIEAGAMKLEPKRLPVGSVLHGVSRLLRERLKKQQLVLDIDAPENGLDLWADERATKQILFNLLSNAIKFTPAGGRISLRAEAATDRVTIVVADTGVGIPADQLDRVLRPFEQLDNRYACARGGTGLGLSLVEGLVTLHGGCLHIASEAGKGTTVTIQLPRAPEEAEEDGSLRVDSPAATG